LPGQVTFLPEIKTALLILIKLKKVTKIQALGSEAY